MGLVAKQLTKTRGITYEKSESLWSKFMVWCESQEEYRIGWMAGALTGHGCVLTPITMFAIVLSGNIFFFWILAILAMSVVLITNLAAMPTRITIPVLLVSILIDLAIIIYCVFAGFDITGTYI